MALTKDDIAEKLYKDSRLGLNKARSKEVVKSVFDLMKETLGKEGDILITGFGKWVVKEKKARKGPNPQRGEEIIIGERKVVSFKTSDKLRDRINNLRDE